MFHLIPVFKKIYSGEKVIYSLINYSLVKLCQIYCVCSNEQCRHRREFFINRINILLLLLHEFSLYRNRKDKYICNFEMNCVSYVALKKTQRNEKIALRLKNNKFIEIVHSALASKLRLSSRYYRINRNPFLVWRVVARNGVVRLYTVCNIRAHYFVINHRRLGDIN